MIGRNQFRNDADRALIQDIYQHSAAISEFTPQNRSLARRAGMTNEFRALFVVTQRLAAVPSKFVVG